MKPTTIKSDTDLSRLREELEPNFWGSRIVYAQNFVVNGAGGIYGHGTHVPGIVAGNGKNSTGWNYFKSFTGVANNAYR